MRWVLTGLCLALLLPVSSRAFAEDRPPPATVEGLWTTFDDGVPQSRIRVRLTPEGHLEARIVEFLKPDTDLDAVCDKCDGARKGQKILGMVITDDLAWDGEKQWSGGKIVDPKNGKTYSAKAKLKSPDTLEIRGYVGISWIGRTVEWKRHPSS